MDSTNEESQSTGKIGDIYTPVDGQHIAVVKKNYGGGIFDVVTYEGKTLKVHQGRSCHAFIQKGDTILCSLRLFGREDVSYTASMSRDSIERTRPQGDVLFKYTEKEVKILTSNGYVMKTPDVSAEFADFGLDNIVFIYKDDDSNSDSDSDDEQIEKSNKGYLAGLDLPDSNSDTDDTDETEILFPIKDDEEEICFSSTVSKTKRERRATKQKEYIDIFSFEKEVERPKHEYVAPKIEIFTGKISWFDRSKNFGEVVSSFEGKEVKIFIPKSSIERSIEQRLMSESKVFFPKDKVKLTAFMGKKGFEAQTISLC